jgi:triacylglycerol lipase
MSPTRPKGTRTHIVLVPGFGGFDALGQIRYYSGLTQLFQNWKASRPTDPRVTLHYFDNLPTAAVVTRAERLRDYLAKRIVRSEFQPGDLIALVGHSTGGLDIRRLLWELSESPDEKVPIDGIGDSDPHAVKRAQILEMIRRVVFLSVPQHGTNIANWVNAHTSLRRIAVNATRDAVVAHSIRPVAALQDKVTAFLGDVSDVDLLFAMQDALYESDEHQFKGDVKREAEALEAHSELWLWTQHIAANFSAIEDLESRDNPSDTSPAHFDASMRARELAHWRKYGITTRSFATVGENPFEPEIFHDRRALTLADPRTWAEFRLRPGARQQMDFAYRWCYRACAAGSFVAPEGQRTATVFGTTTQRELQDWENDGIVNTASMLWPDGAETQLVKGDHGDIIGHYRRIGDSAKPGRRFSSYDLLRSASQFGDEEFKHVWRDVLEFCTPASP